MIKIDIVNRTNLTLLAKAYLEDLLPKGKAGEVFFDYDDKNEIKSIYFSNKDYYNKLIKTFNANMLDISTSNNFIEWINLFTALQSYETIEKVDYGKLEHYHITEKNEIENIINFDTVNKEDSFLINVKRIYQAYDVTYWGNENLVVIKLPFICDEIFNFDLKPLIELLNMVEKKLIKFNIYRDPSRHITVVRIQTE